MIVGLLHEDVDLTEINHSGNPVTVTGTSPDEDGIFEYARDLRSSGRFSLVVISSIEAIREGEGEEIEGFNFEFRLISNTRG